MLILTEDQQLLRDSAREFVEGRYPVSRFRDFRESDQRTDPALWRELVELGWPALPLPEAQDGLGLGLADLVVVMEQAGRHLLPTPMISTWLASQLHPSPALAEGKIVALAWREHVRLPELQHCSTRHVRGTLTGHKRAVLDASGAQEFLVTARDEDGTLGLFLVDAAHASLTPMERLDHRDCARVAFQDSPATRLDAREVDIQAALDSATVLLCAEMLGGMSEALRLTLDYLRTRHQFGVPIGSFQALQHRAVDCYLAIELARSTVLAAARTPDTQTVSLCKSQCNEAYLKVTREAVQMFGGIGMTDEHDIGLYLKRAHVAAITLGDTPWHRDRWGQAHGY